MSRFLPEPNFSHGTAPQVGVLLINLGTPHEPSPHALRRYLKEFLSDPRVVEIPRAVWLPILRGIILNVRPTKSARKYAKIWTSEGSPLKVHTQKQAKLLRGWLGDAGYPNLHIDYAMRYGEPSIDSRLAQMKAANCNRILIVPLYPQYAASTTASSFDAVSQYLSRVRNQPELRFVRNFHDQLGYIKALAASVRQHWSLSSRPEMLVMSFHGLPRYCLDKGDPYYCECQKTSRLLAEALELQPQQYQVSFQSRFGRARWLQPYTLPMLKQLAKNGLKRVDLICPGFVADCLETLEEVAMECRAAFLDAGGTAFYYIPALNERAEWIAALGQLVRENLGSWITQPQADATALAARADRAKARGAPL